MENQELTLTEEQRLAKIGDMVKAVKNGKVPSIVDEELATEHRAEKATEDLVVAHGLLSAKGEDVEDEKQFLQVDEEVDFDKDENEINMVTLSPSMREVSRG